jgi:hypothetical protein
MTSGPFLMILSSIEYSAISTSLASTTLAGTSLAQSTTLAWSTTLAGTTLASTTLTHHKDKVYVIYLTYNIKDSTKMQGEPGIPVNHDHHQSSSNQIVDQREQGV